jgi:hypothetical protein
MFHGLPSGQELEAGGGVPDSCPSRSSSDFHRTRHSGKFVTTDHDGRLLRIEIRTRLVALATTSVRLTTFKMQNSLSIGFLEIFMVFAGVAQEFRSLARSGFLQKKRRAGFHSRPTRQTRPHR